MIKLYDEQSKCCGCSACLNICPKNAISMEESELGTLYPKIDPKLCVECGLCKKVCNFQNRTDYSTKHKAFAATTKDDEIIMNSTSGGIFTTLAQQFIKDGGYVSGAIYDDDFNVVHIVTNRLSDLKKIQGSKYVQSSTTDVYPKIKKLLNSGEKVLFSGTPCQVDGLYGFLMKDYDNLITIDIVCHGVPSNKLFKDYLKTICKNNENIIDVKFRDKTQSWGTFGTVTLQNGNSFITKEINGGTSSYYHMFLNNLIFRTSCYSCKYASINRPADITIGDFWGIEKVNSELLKNTELNTKKGISLLITNNDKGESYISYNKKCFYMYDTTVEKVSFGNHNLKKPSSKPTKRSTLSNLYRTNNFDGILESVKKGMFKEKIKITVKKLIPTNIKEKLKKYMN